MHVGTYPLVLFLPHTPGLTLHLLLVVLVVSLDNHRATLVPGQKLREALEPHLATLKLDFLGRRKGRMQVHENNHN
jgi:hypothetical protein